MARSKLAQNADTSGAEALAAFVIAVGSIPFLVLWRGLVIMKVWAWHMVTVFTMLPTLTVSQAISVSLVVSMLTHQYTSDKISAANEDDSILTKTFKNAALGFFIYLFVLLWAWVIHLFQT